MPNHERVEPASLKDAQSISELAWLKENLAPFWATAYGGYRDEGRGVLVIDTRREGLSEDSPFYYVPQADFVSQEDGVSQQMVELISEYDPDRQLVAVFIRPDEGEYEFSMFQLAITEEALIDAAHSAGTEPAAIPEREIEPPDLETLMIWENEGGCEAACPHSCWVEPDGRCSHGYQSWLLELGLI